MWTLWWMVGDLQYPFEAPRGFSPQSKIWSITHEIPWIIEEIIVNWINLWLARKDRCMLGICRIYFRKLYHVIIFLIFNIYTLCIFLYIYILKIYIHIYIYTWVEWQLFHIEAHWDACLPEKKSKAIDCLFFNKGFFNTYSRIIHTYIHHIYCNVC